jgi:hypothetical protein
VFQSKADITTSPPENERLSRMLSPSFTEPEKMFNPPPPVIGNTEFPRELKTSYTMSKPVPGTFPGSQFQERPTWYQNPEAESPLRRYAGPNPEEESDCSIAVTL